MDKTTILCYSIPTTQGEATVLAATLISFHEIPRFGFAHHVYTENTRQIQNDLQHSFVLLYVKSGHLTAQIYGRTLEAPAGSVLVLFRHVPFQLFSVQKAPQDYCSIQVYTDYSFSVLEDGEDFPSDFAGLALPMAVPPGSEAEAIKKDMLSIISSLSVSRELYSFSTAMTVSGILSRLDAFYRQKQHRGKSASFYWEYKIKRYIAEHIRSLVSLETLADAMGKTPNYLNNVFSRTAGISIHQYINREKTRLIAALMEDRALSFREACENVGITDLSHGYRLFKRHMGVTPKQYMTAERMHPQSRDSH